jgi:hypothetical protein
VKDLPADFQWLRLKLSHLRHIYLSFQLNN